MIENGLSQRPRKLREIARVLGTTDTWLLGEIEDEAGPTPPALKGAPDPLPPSNASQPIPFVLPSQKIPIYGRAVGGIDGRMIFNGEKLGEVYAIPALANVPNAYALYVSGESMEPRYFAGEVVYVHPTRPPARGDHVVVEIQPDSDGEPPYGFVKRYLRWTGPELILGQYNPEVEIRIPSEKVIRVNVIMGTGAG